MRRALRIIAFPLAVLAVFGLLYLIWLALDLPPEDTMVRIAKDYLDRHGMLIVFIAAYLEGLLLIGWYFPGTLVIILAPVLAGPATVRVAPITATAVCRSLASSVPDLRAGQSGW